MKKKNLTFTLIAYTEGELCNSYRVLEEKVNFGEKYIVIVKSTFIVDKDQTIHKTWYNVKRVGYISKVLDAVEALKERGTLLRDKFILIYG